MRRASGTITILTAGCATDFWRASNRNSLQPQLACRHSCEWMRFDSLSPTRGEESAITRICCRRYLSLNSGSRRTACPKRYEHSAHPILELWQRENDVEAAAWSTC